LNLFVYDQASQPPGTDGSGDSDDERNEHARQAQLATSSTAVQAGEQNRFLFPHLILMGIIMNALRK
jgi:hypothetical protein